MASLTLAASWAFGAVASFTLAASWAFGAVASLTLAASWAFGAVASLTLEAICAGGQGFSGPVASWANAAVESSRAATAAEARSDFMVGLLN